MRTVTDTNLLQILPHPFTGLLTVSVGSTLDESAVINIYNEYGSAVYRSELSVRPGINRTDIELQDCPPGVYYLHYKTPLSKLFVIRRLEKIEESLSSRN